MRRKIVPTHDLWPLRMPSRVPLGSQTRRVVSMEPLTCDNIQPFMPESAQWPSGLSQGQKKRKKKGEGEREREKSELTSLACERVARTPPWCA
jgi:hypothetical protein